MLGITNRLEDGGFLQVWTDISDIKKKENDMQQLIDAIDEIPNVFMLWDRDNKLIHSNKLAKKISKETHKFDLKDGVSRKQFVGAMIKSGMLEVPKGITIKKFIIHQVIKSCIFCQYNIFKSLVYISIIPSFTYIFDINSM